LTNASIFDNVLAPPLEAKLLEEFEDDLFSAVLLKW
jgi:hypothetical protein